MLAGGADRGWGIGAGFDIAGLLGAGFTIGLGDTCRGSPIPGPSRSDREGVVRAGDFISGAGPYAGFRAGNGAGAGAGDGYFGPGTSYFGAGPSYFGAGGSYLGMGAGRSVFCAGAAGDFTIGSVAGLGASGIAGGLAGLCGIPAAGDLLGCAEGFPLSGREGLTPGIGAEGEGLVTGGFAPG